MGYIVTGSIIVVIVLVAILAMWRKAPQDKAIVVTGLKKRIISGGGGVVIPFFEQTHRISLENIKVEVKTDDSLDKDGVPLCTDGVVLVKIKSEKESILYAMEQFNTGKEKETIEVIRSTVQDILEGKIREIVSQLSIQELYSNRQMFSDEVEKVAKEDLTRMGLEIKTFTIRDISDKNGYLTALGVKQIAHVKKEASIAQAEADREETQRTSEARRLGEEARLLAETEIAHAEKEKELKLQSYKEEQNRAKAKADYAYVVEENIVKKQVIETDKNALLFEEQRQTEIAEQQAKRKEKELEAVIKKQADAEKYRLEKDAEAKRYRAQQEAEASKFTIEQEAEGKRLERLKQAEAEAEAISRIGRAEAEAIRAKGEATAAAMMAEAEAMKEKAEAYKQYGDAAVIEMLASRLPEIAKYMSEPLAKTDKMVIIDNGGDGGASKVTKTVSKMMAEVPEVVESLTGIDLIGLVKDLQGKQTPQAKDTEEVTDYFVES